MTATKQNTWGNLLGGFFFWKKPPAPPRKTASQYILGLSISAEGSAAAVLGDGKVLFSAFEPPPPAGGYPAAFPSAAVRTALEKASEEEGEILGVRDLAAVAFCGKPLGEYARLHGEWMSRAPAGFRRFLDAAPSAFNKKRLGEGLLSRELAAVSWGEAPSILLYPEHQLACAASAFYWSPFQDSAILVLDGPCEGPAAAICLGSGEKIKTLRELLYPDSPQALSSALTEYAGFGGDSAWELFTLPEEGGSRAREYYDKITGELADIRDDGSLRLNPSYFAADDGMKPDHRRWRDLFGLPPRGKEALAGEHLDFAIAARMAIEEIVFRLGAQAKRLACSTNLCLCSGMELKLAAEGKLKKAGIFSSIWSQPYSAPEGKAAGAALAARHIYLGTRRSPSVPSTWSEPAEPAAPEESAAPLKIAPETPLSATSRLAYAAYFFLKLSPAAAYARLSRAKEPGTPKAGARTTFYAVRSRIYSGEDLETPG